MIKNINRYLILALILISYFTLSLLVLDFVPIQEADGYSRVVIARDLAYTPGSIFRNFLQGGDWLPLYFSLFAGLIRIFGKPMFTVRFFTLVFSSLGILFFYFIVKLAFRSKSIAIFSLLFLVTSYFFINLSLQPLSEPIFNLFFLIALYLLLKRRYIFSFVFLNFANMVRYEGWFLTLAFLCFMIYEEWREKRFSIRKSSLFLLFCLLLSIAFPSFWMAVNFKMNNDPLFFLREKMINAQIGDHGGETFSLVFASETWLKKLFEILPIYSFPLFFYGLFFILKSKSKEAIFLFILSFCIYTSLVFQVFTGSMEWRPARFLNLTFLFLVPFVITGAIETQRLNKFLPRIILIIIFSLNLLLSYKNLGVPDLFYNLRDYTSRKAKYNLKNLDVLGKTSFDNSSEEDSRELIGFLHSFLSPDSFYTVGAETNNSRIILETEIPPGRYQEFSSVAFQVRTDSWQDAVRDVIIHGIKERGRDNYFVFSQEEIAPRIVGLDCQNIGEGRFLSLENRSYAYECIFQNSSFTVFKIYASEGF